MMKSQSAMEYLMTYGWAILIIAVVLSVLFQLGVFSSGNFQPRAQAGACQVSRTVAGISLEGQCNGMLPQYVAQFNWGSTSGSGNFLSMPTPLSILGSNTICNITVAAWSYDAGMDPSGNLGGTVSLYGGSGSTGWLDVEYDDNNLRFETRNSLAGNAAGIAGSYKGTWLFVVSEISNQKPVGYINGLQVWSSSPDIGCIGFAGTRVGAWDKNFNGYISNIQIYNVSLSPAEVNALYLEGIGGAPIRPQNLIAWWPFNGNLNDYSGLETPGTPGVTGNVGYSGSWTSTYTAP
jgi:hypothetical protein